MCKVPQSILYFNSLLSEFIDTVLQTFVGRVFVTFVDKLSRTFIISSHTITESPTALHFKYLLISQMLVLGCHLKPFVHMQDLLHSHSYLLSFPFPFELLVKLLSFLLKLC